MSYYKRLQMLSANANYSVKHVLAHFCWDLHYRLPPPPLSLCFMFNRENNALSNYSVNGRKQGLDNMLHAVLLI